MTAEFGDFANIDPDRALQKAHDHAAKMAGIQEKLSAVSGHAESSDGYVKATFTPDGGLTELELNPRVMRMASIDLAQTIKDVIREAASDMQRQLTSQMARMFEGEEDSPMDFVTNPEKADAKIEEMQGVLNGTLNNALGELEKIRKQLGI